MTQVSDRAARMLAAWAEIIERILKSAELHCLDPGEFVAASVHASAAALMAAAGVSAKEAGEALQTSIRRYLIEMAPPPT